MTEQGDALDEILSAETTTVVDAGATTTTEADRARDEHGRFAPKANETTTTTETTTQVQPPADGQQQGTVPHQALHAAREEGRGHKDRADKAEADAAELRRQLAELTGKVDVLSRQQPARPAQAQEQPKPKEFWEDPDSFLAQRLSPLEQSIQRQRESFSRMMAVSQHGSEKVSAAYKAMADALATSPQTAVHEYRRIMATDHPYDELVNWHSRSQTLARIGNDPDAWLKTQLQEMLKDPAKQAEILKQIQSSAPPATTVAPARSAPSTQVPPTLSRLPAGGLADDADESLEALTRR